MCLPPYKKEPGTYTRTHPHFTLIFQFHVISLLTLFHSTWSSLLDISLQVYIFSSHIVAMYICIINLYLFSLRHFTWHILYNAIYIFLFIFLEFYQVQCNIYILLFHILSMYIYASIYIYLVCYILLGTFYIMKYIFVVIFLEFYQVGRTDLPHHKNQVSTLAMIHSFLMWPFQTILFQLSYEIFSNILFLDHNYLLIIV